MLDPLSATVYTGPVSQTKAYVPHTQEEYQEAIMLLDNLVDQVGEDESHPLASLMEVLGVLIEKYEDDHIPEVTDL